MNTDHDRKNSNEEHFLFYLSDKYGSILKAEKSKEDHFQLNYPKVGVGSAGRQYRTFQEGGRN